MVCPHRLCCIRGSPAPRGPQSPSSTFNLPTNSAASTTRKGVCGPHPKVCGGAGDRADKRLVGLVPQHSCSGTDACVHHGVSTSAVLHQGLPSTTWSSIAIKHLQLAHELCCKYDAEGGMWAPPEGMRWFPPLADEFMWRALAKAAVFPMARQSTNAYAPPGPRQRPVWSQRVSRLRQLAQKSCARHAIAPVDQLAHLLLGFL